MISIVTSIYNAKLDFLQFLRQVQATNDFDDFEFIIVHDDRVDDGSRNLLEQLSKDYSNIKIVAHVTKEETLARIYSIYESRKDKLIPEIINRSFYYIKKYEENEIDSSKTEFWISPVHFLDAAANQATGDFILITPCDRLIGFSLKELETWAKPLVKDGHFYTRLPLLHLNVTNIPYEEARELDIKYDAVSNIIRSHSHYTFLLTRKYPLFSENLDKYWVKYPLGDGFSSLGASNLFSEIKRTANHEKVDRLVPLVHKHHGLHFMTKKTWEASGGYALDFLSKTIDEHVLIKRCMPWFYSGPTLDFCFIEPRRHAVSLKEHTLADCLEVDIKAKHHPIMGASNFLLAVAPEYISKVMSYEMELYGIDASLV